MSSSGKKGGSFTHKLYFDPRADQPDTGGYRITDTELREKLETLIDTSESIEKASVYSNPLSSLQATNALLYHAFIVMETRNWWWSIEKNTEGVTIQRSKDLASVRDKYQRKKRTTGWTPLTGIRMNETTECGSATIKKLIYYIWRKDLLNDVYHLLEENCQKFAALIFDRLRSPYNDLVYFDQAADRPLPKGESSCYMSIDNVFDEVERLSHSETFSRVELYKVPLHLWTIPGLFVPNFMVSLFKLLTIPTGGLSALLHESPYHYFVLFVTNNGTYWSFERLPTRFTIQRASNKDILVKNCQRVSRCNTPLSSVEMKKSSIAVKKNMNAVMNSIWNRNDLHPIHYLPPMLCGSVAERIYQEYSN